MVQLRLERPGPSLACETCYCIVHNGAITDLQRDRIGKAGVQVKLTEVRAT